MLYIYSNTENQHPFYLTYWNINFVKQLFIYLVLYQENNEISFETYITNLSVDDINIIVNRLEIFISNNSDCFFFVFLENNNTKLLNPNKNGWIRIYFKYKIYYKNINKEIYGGIDKKVLTYQKENIDSLLFKFSDMMYTNNIKEFIKFLKLSNGTKIGS